MTVEILTGDALDRLRELPADSVHCCVTSPPYWGLRDYGTGAWEGGDPACDHVAGMARQDTDRETPGGRGGSFRGGEVQFRDICGKCGARLVDQQIGLEHTPDLWVARLVEVFREVRRVLRPDGTLWLNVGDSYAGSWGAQGRTGEMNSRSVISAQQIANAQHKKSHTGSIPDGSTCKPKDLIGQPWLLAKALREPYYTGRIKSDADRIWLAAIIDAEGCLFIHRRKAGQHNGQGYYRTNDNFGPGLEVSNTSRAIVERCLEITGLGSICTQGPNENARRKQLLYRWNLRTIECRDVIREIYPHLVAKQYQARLLCGCPSSGDDAVKAHLSLIALHRGKDPTIDFKPPTSMFEPGWYLRAEIVWNKSNPMPESVRDRPTKAHEQVFLLTKSGESTFWQHRDLPGTRTQPAPDYRWMHKETGEEVAEDPGDQENWKRINLWSGRDYFYDQEAVREAGSASTSERWGDQPDRKRPNGQPTPSLPGENTCGINPAGRNARSVWTIATEPNPLQHFASYPQELARRCILAGTSAKGCCPKCGAPVGKGGGIGH